MAKNKKHSSITNSWRSVLNLKYKGSKLQSPRHFAASDLKPQLIPPKIKKTGLKNWVGVAIIGLIFVTMDAQAILIDTFDVSGEQHIKKSARNDDPAQVSKRLKHYLRTGKIISLSQEITDLLKKGSVTSEVYLLNSVALIAQGHNKKGEEQLKKAGDERSKYALYARAMMHRNKGQYSEAKKVIQKALKLDRQHPYAWNIKGRIHHTEQNLSESHR